MVEAKRTIKFRPLSELRLVAHISLLYLLRVGAQSTGKFTDFGSCSAWLAIVAALGEVDDPLKSSERRASCLQHLAKGWPDMGHQTVITQCETWATSRPLGTSQI